MKIVSWNVNGIRACEKKGLATWLAETDAKIVGFQEVRADPTQVPETIASMRRWKQDYFAAQKAGYSGVGLLSRAEPDDLARTMGVPAFDVEGRFQCATFGKLRVVNVYVPNGAGPNRDLSRIPYKLDFSQRLFDLFAKDLRDGGRVLIFGDFNTAHEEIDLARPKDNVENSGFRPEERAEFGRWLAAGWIDTFRHFEKAGGHYTWWTQRGGARERNVGWRIDYVLATPGAMAFVKNAAIHPEVLGSDHCPVSVTLDPKIVK
ncbi:MAG: exodeoxyribonuclease III [Deltaproteobacteria bacterium]|nr:exodeoxyribonuclease III [Deltaproteobacteria bacterium]